jgi:hypothetical protein
MHSKTASFFDIMCFASYAKEQVSTEAIKLVYDGGQPSAIQRSFAWTEDIADESTGEEVEYCMSENREEIFETDSIASFPYQAKSPSGTASTTATTVTMNTYNTMESWETLRTSPASASYDSAMVPETNSPPLLTIAVLFFKPNPDARPSSTAIVDQLQLYIETAIA